MFQIQGLLKILFGEEFLREDGTITVCVCCGDILYVIKRPWYVNVQFDQYTV